MEVTAVSIYRMPLQDSRETVDLDALQEHLSEALDSAENDQTTYHIREACQKVVILKGNTQRNR
jgi:hypothetical protein